MTYLTEYWAQITVLIGALGFLIKSIVDGFLKRYEIRFKVLHEQRLIQISEFYKCYLGLEFKLKDFYHMTMFSDLSQENRIDLQNNLAEKWREFIYRLKLLRIFLSPSDLQLLEEIENHLDETHRTIDFHWIDREYKTVDKDNWEKLTEIRKKIFPEKLPELLTRLEKSLRKSYR